MCVAIRRIWFEPSAKGRSLSSTSIVDVAIYASAGGMDFG